MDTNLQHEDLLIKLRAKLNEEKIKLWESPFLQPDNSVSESLQKLAEKYSAELSVESETVLTALHELQLHSLERSKANAEFKETGCATFRVRATLPGEKATVFKVQKKLDVLGGELIDCIAAEIGVEGSRVKLIINGKVIKHSSSLEEQGVKNGAQIMALIVAENLEDLKKEDSIYSEMKATRDDAKLLSESMFEEYMKLEDQSGKAVHLPPTEKQALLVGLALHERGRSAAGQGEYPLALLLFLEADRQLGACRSQLLRSVDNWAILQLDIAWCYLCLRSLSCTADAEARLNAAAEAFRRSYGEDHRRVVALKGTAANERVLLMRLYLLQGIVAYHQNKRTDARELLLQAELELNSLRVDESSVSALVELGWSVGQARGGLRASGGDVNLAHHLLAERKAQRDKERENHRLLRCRRLGQCADGSPVDLARVGALVGMGFAPPVARAALRASANHVAHAVRIIQEQPELLVESDVSSPSSEESLVEPDNKLVAELEAMGFAGEEAREALSRCANAAPDAVALLLRLSPAQDAENPSTSSDAAATRLKRNKRRKEREMALSRLKANIGGEEDEYLDTSLVEEERFLAQYKALL